MIADGVWQQIFNFDNYGELLVLVRNSLIAGAALGVVGGLVGVFVIRRDLRSRCTASANCRSPAPRRHCCWGRTSWRARSSDH